MKYPIGIQSFEQIIEDGYVYVDKTDLVYSLVKEGKIYFFLTSSLEKHHFYIFLIINCL